MCRSIKTLRRPGNGDDGRTGGRRPPVRPQDQRLPRRHRLGTPKRSRPPSRRSPHASSQLVESDRRRRRGGTEPLDARAACREPASLLARPRRSRPDGDQPGQPTSPRDARPSPDLGAVVGAARPGHRYRRPAAHRRRATPKPSRANTGRRSSSTIGRGSRRTPGDSRRPSRRPVLPFRLRFAMKANPLPEVLEVFRGLGEPGTPESVGIDACSPARSCAPSSAAGCPTRSATPGTNVSERDLDVLLRAGVHLNLDAISQIERFGQRARARRSASASTREPAPDTTSTSSTAAPGRPSSASPSIASTRRSRPPRGTTSAVDTVHFHAGSGWLAGGLAGFEQALADRSRGRSLPARRRP